MRKNPTSNGNRELSAKGQAFRPEDFPVGSLQSRAAARTMLLQNQKRIQTIFFVRDQPLKLETSKCERRIWPDGTLFELVSLDGKDTDLTEEQLDAFIEQHPIIDNHDRRIHE